MAHAVVLVHILVRDKPSPEVDSVGEEDEAEAEHQQLLVRRLVTLILRVRKVDIPSLRRDGYDGFLHQSLGEFHLRAGVRVHESMPGSKWGTVANTSAVPCTTRAHKSDAGAQCSECHACDRGGDRNGGFRSGNAPLSDT